MPRHEEELPMNAPEEGPTRSAARGSRALKLAGVLAVGSAAALGLASLGYATGSAQRVDVGASIGGVEIEIRPPWMSCSGRSRNCRRTRCCKWSGSRCYTKNETFAECVETCGTGKTAGWACKKLSHWAEGKLMASVLPPKLFCFEAFMVDLGRVKKNIYDIELIRIQLRTKTSVFGCTDWRVFADKVVELSPGNPGPALYTVQVETPHVESRRMTGQWINGPQFISIWRYIRLNKLYEPYHWTVKADVDAVFIPQRLVARLADQPVTEKGVYITNCRHAKDALIGPLEVVSHNAVGKFVANLEFCMANINWTVPGHVYGEDKFFNRCMYKIGVDTVEDFNVIQENLCAACYKNRKIAEKEHRAPDSKDLWGLVVIPKCRNTSAIAFHPLPTPKDYSACVARTQR